MPYRVGKSSECPKSKPHAVIKEDDGKVMGCHSSKSKAHKQIAAIEASEKRRREGKSSVKTKSGVRRENPYNGKPSPKDPNTDPKDIVDRVDALLQDDDAPYDPESPNETDEPLELPERWEAVLIIEEERTTDNREIAMEGLTWRTLPIPLMAKFEDTHGGGLTSPPTHIVGKIEEIERVTVGGKAEIRARGSFDLMSEKGQDAARMVRDQILRWVSGDVEAIEVEHLEEGDCEDQGLLDILLAEQPEIGFDDEDSDGDDEEEKEPCIMVMRLKRGRIMGATLVAFPAFPGAVIVPEGALIPEMQGEDGRAATTAGACEECDDMEINSSWSWTEPSEETLVASGATTLRPPSNWFENPKLDYPTPLTITSEGRVYGHVAQWGVCHVGIRDKCVLAPRSRTGYESFHTGGFVETDDGEFVRVGHLTMDCGHADLDLNATQTRRHYEDSACIWANVRAGEDVYGIYVSGALMPGLTEEQIVRARACAISGDWRSEGGGLEMIAALTVPVPGFPVARGLVASSADHPVTPRPRVLVDGYGNPLALVAAGMVMPEAPEDKFERRLAAVERTLADDILQDVQRGKSSRSAR